MSIVRATDIALDKVGHLGSSHATRVWQASVPGRVVGTVADRGFYHIHGEWVTRLSVYSGGAEIARDLTSLEQAVVALRDHLNRIG